MMAQRPLGRAAATAAGATERSLLSPMPPPLPPSRQRPVMRACDWGRPSASSSLPSPSLSFPAHASWSHGLGLVTHATAAPAARCRPLCAAASSAATTDSNVADATAAEAASASPSAAAAATVPASGPQAPAVAPAATAGAPEAAAPGSSSGDGGGGGGDSVASAVLASPSRQRSGGARGGGKGAGGGGAGGSRQPGGRDPGLRKVPGVGPKNEALFRDQGLTNVDDLLRLRQTHDGADLKAFFQDVVGIKNKGHLSMIVGYLEELDGKAAEATTLGGHLGQQPKVTLSVEGNISAGKTTFLQILKDSGMDKSLHVVPEPVEKWQNVGGSHVNLLLQFYEDPQRFAYTFQNYVFLTRMVQERESYSASMCRLLERSIFSDRMVFVRAVHNLKFLSDTELAVYDSWFDPMLKTLPTLVPNGFIYLRANPDTCFRRMQKRSRNEESSVQLEYLQDLHQHHEDWLWSGGVRAADSKYLYIPNTRQTLINSAAGSGAAAGRPLPGSPTLSMRGPAVGCADLPKIPAALRDSLYILDTAKSDKLLPSLDQIPALVLNCDDDVDVDNDADYRMHVSEQVRLYTEYVRNFTRAKANLQFSQLHTPTFNGYYLQDNVGNIMYTAPEWHSLSHADRQVTMDQFNSTLGKVERAAASIVDLQGDLRQQRKWDAAGPR